MKTEYAPDNTRTSILVVLGLAAVVSVIAVLIGLSPKPQVDAIVVSANGESAAPGLATTPNFGDDLAKKSNARSSWCQRRNRHRPRP